MTASVTIPAIRLCIQLQIVSVAHFQDVVSRATGADSAAPDGYLDAKGRWRHPHKLMLVEVYADWCRACKGLQPKLLKYIKNHPEVLCCKINKTKNEARKEKKGTIGSTDFLIDQNERVGN